MVKRYMEYVDGELQCVVLYDDYTALAERCERLEAALRRAGHFVAFARSQGMRGAEDIGRAMDDLLYGSSGGKT